MFTHIPPTRVNSPTHQCPLTHPPLTRVNLPIKVKPPTYQCRLTTYQSPRSTPTDPPAQANSSCFRLHPTWRQTHPLTVTRKPTKHSRLCYSSSVCFHSQTLPCDIGSHSHACLHRHIHPLVTHPPLTPSHTHIHTHPAMSAHSRAGSHLFTTHVPPQDHTHTQSSCICTPTLILSLQSDTHVDVTDTLTYPETHARTHAHPPLSLTCILFLTALFDLSPAHEGQGYQQCDETHREPHGHPQGLRGECHGLPWEGRWGEWRETVMPGPQWP